MCMNDYSINELNIIYIYFLYIYIYIYIHLPATLLGTPVQLLGNTNC